MTKARGFNKDYFREVSHLDLTETTKTVLRCVLNLRESSDGWLYYPIATKKDRTTTGTGGYISMRDVTGLSKMTIIRALKALQDQGFITRKRLSQGEGNYYRLLPHPDLPQKLWEHCWEVDFDPDSSSFRSDVLALIKRLNIPSVVTSESDSRSNNGVPPKYQNVTSPLINTETVFKQKSRPLSSPLETSARSEPLSIDESRCDVIDIKTRRKYVPTLSGGGKDLSPEQINEPGQYQVGEKEPMRNFEEEDLKPKQLEVLDIPQIQSWGDLWHNVKARRRSLGIKDQIVPDERRKTKNQYLSIVKRYEAPHFDLVDEVLSELVSDGKPTVFLATAFAVKYNERYIDFRTETGRMEKSDIFSYVDELEKREQAEEEMKAARAAARTGKVARDV